MSFVASKVGAPCSPQAGVGITGFAICAVGWLIVVAGGVKSSSVGGNGVGKSDEFQIGDDSSVNQL